MNLNICELSLQKTDLQIRTVLSLYIIVSFIACQPSSPKNNLNEFTQDSVLVSAYIHKGDSIYAQKASYLAFSKSLDLYDSAWHVAEKNGDTGLMAVSIFAKGRAYDAINNNPKKTIEYYTEAARLFAALPHMKQKALYIKHLVAHSYDKIEDSLNCIKILKELYRDISVLPDSIKKQLRFIPEMALISTVVENYAFADSILQNLTERDWIENDPTEYDYLNHYYLTKAKIAVHQKHLSASTYIDSLENVFANSRNLNDSVYYSNELWELNKTMGNKSKENYYLQVNNKTFNKFNPPEKVREVQEKLSRMEIASVEERRIAETEKAAMRQWFIYALIALVVIISLLALFLHKRNREIKRKKNEVIIVNEELNQKNQQNELLNKEIHHRVKNNLQMILSLVYMQERKTDTEEVKENMRLIRLRIESIARLHEQLMHQADSVDLHVYVQQLVTNVSKLLNDNKNIITHLQIESLQVPQKTSFALGLILNEWITNSVKYAAVNNALELFIEISNDHNQIKVQYQDNGLPQMAGSVNSSLGLDIVNLLAAQLNAELKTSADNFFSYTLIIPIA
jgi:two-component sensor histidine kinase